MPQISRGKFDHLQRATAGLQPVPFDGYGLRSHVPARPAPYASDPVLVHRLASLLRASFRPRLAASVISPLRFAITSRPSRCEEDFHLQTVKHARHTQKRPRLCAGAESGLQSERSVVGLRRWLAGRSLQFLLAAIELAHDIGANGPRRDLRGLGLLAFAVGLLVARANEGALDENVSAPFNSRSNALCQERPEHNDPMPLSFRTPLIIDVLPGALCGEREYGELHTCLSLDVARDQHRRIPRESLN